MKNDFETCSNGIKISMECVLERDKLTNEGRELLTYGTVVGCMQSGQFEF